jgi:hypothetical protein
MATQCIYNGERGGDEAINPPFTAVQVKRFQKKCHMSKIPQKNKRVTKEERKTKMAM